MAQTLSEPPALVPAQDKADRGDDMRLELRTKELGGILLLPSPARRQDPTLTLHSHSGKKRSKEGLLGQCLVSHLAHKLENHLKIDTHTHTHKH